MEQERHSAASDRHGRSWCAFLIRLIKGINTVEIALKF